VLGQLVERWDVTPIAWPQGVPADAWVDAVDAVDGTLVRLSHVATGRHVLLTTNERVRRARP
jgi:hypothetical protein